jgi:DNA modification methylase
MTSARLFYGNSAAMSEVGDCEANLVIACPPYFPDWIEPALRSGKVSTDNIEEMDAVIRSFAYDQRPVFDECFRVLSTDGTMVVQTRDVRLAHRLVGVESIHRSLIESSGLVLVSRHLWRPEFTTKKRLYKQASDKIQGKPHPLDAESFLVFQHADTLGKSHPSEIDVEALESDIVVSGKGRLANPHRFQAPIPLLEVMVRTFSDEGDLVVDPYAGGGTTLSVALAMNRRAIGYEIDSDTYEGALRNLPQAHKSSYDD